jgi:hypothetical protein
MTSEILTEMKILMFFFWIVKLHGLVGRYQCFRGTYFNPKDGSTMIL